jgi:dihydrodipicolinate synthase/N-acetylneuraminate lyase
MSGQLQCIIPPMTTPFDPDGAIDDEAVRAQVRWVPVAGVHSLGVGGSTAAYSSTDARGAIRAVWAGATYVRAAAE